jgi:methionyl-tRNA formyltransferase
MLKIYMLGSGPIAGPVLEKLYQQAQAGEFELLGVGTQPDRPAGRKRQLMPTPVGEFAAANGIEIDKFDNLNSPEALAKIGALQPDFLLVVSYGQLLKKPLLELPRYGCVNIHASLLPRYRGASPIMHAIANGDNATGVCFMDMEIGLDSGKVYKTLTRELNGSEYADSLEIELGKMAAAETLSTLQAIADGALPGTPQDAALVTMTTKIKKSDGIIDWTKPADEIFCQIRGLAPAPGAYTMWNDQRLKIWKSRVNPKETGKEPGTLVEIGKDYLLVQTGKGCLEILELQPAGKKAMPAKAFCNGTGVEAGVQFGELNG